MITGIGQNPYVRYLVFRKHILKCLAATAVALFREHYRPYGSTSTQVLVSLILHSVYQRAGQGGYLCARAGLEVFRERHLAQGSISVPPRRSDRVLQVLHGHSCSAPDYTEVCQDTLAGDVPMCFC